MSEARESVARLIRDAFHDYGAEVARPWVEIGEDQLGWLELADKVMAVCEPELARLTAERDEARKQLKHWENRYCAVAGYSSRVCRFGTKSCISDHGDAAR